jgi:hypothetical protein
VTPPDLGLLMAEACHRTRRAAWIFLSSAGGTARYSRAPAFAAGIHAERHLHQLPHKDTQGEASRLADDLREALPGVQIFRDVETIAPGEDFVVALERALADCSVMLVLIDRSARGARCAGPPQDRRRERLDPARSRNRPQAQ